MPKSPKAQQTIRAMQQEAWEIADTHGWHEKQREIPELLCLIHAEVSEALEEYRNNRPLAYVNRKGAVVPYYDEAGNVKALNGEKPEGLAFELADTVIRIMDVCGCFNIDLQNAIRAKMDFNKTREYRHGNKVC